MILPMARKLLNPAASSSQEIKFMTLWLGTSISLSPSTSLLAEVSEHAFALSHSS